MEQISKRLMNWASVLEQNTRDQAIMSSQMPFIYPHLALMPDAHLGKGATVGSVIPTLGAIMPAAVGVDIGCGMHAVLTQYTESDIRESPPLRLLWEFIAFRIPLSAGKYNDGIYHAETQDRIDELENMSGYESAERIAPNWRLQLGSLGSGNHFIEVSLDERNRVWLFLHSGSRGVGNKLAMRHIRIAQNQCRQRWINLPHEDLAYLVEDDKEFWDYIRDLRWAQHFALLNRQEMMARVLYCMDLHMGEQTQGLEVVQCHHNYTEQEHHFGKTVWLSRKGAINAQLGVLGLVPGSMGTRSYVVIGKGNQLSLNSSPHGAGREYSRSAARKHFTRPELDAAMVGIEWGRSDAFLDEIPGAYKDIDVVMHDASDLVEIKHTLRQIVNVKGD